MDTALARKLKRDEEMYVLDDGVLWRLVDRADSRGSYSRLVVPTTMREKMMKMVHEDMGTGGHFSIRKAYAKARERWYWPTMRADLVAWIKACRQCQRFLYRQGRNLKVRPDRPRVIANEPWDSVYVDAVGPLPGGKFMLVAVCHHSRYASAKVVTRLTADTYVEWLMELITLYGPMRRVTSDRGSNFVSRLAEVLCRVMDIMQHFNTSWRPQATGLIERLIGTLKMLIREYAEEQGGKWERGVQCLVYAYNTTPHSATGYTPFYLFHGREARMPYDWMMERQHEVEPRTIAQYAESMTTAVTIARSNARRHQEDILRDRDWQLPMVETELKVPRYEVDQWVYVSQPKQLRARKDILSTPIYSGPYKILQRISALVYVIDKNGHHDKVHVDRLRLYRSRDQDEPARRYERMVTRERAHRQEQEDAERARQPDLGAETDAGYTGSSEADREELQGDEEKKVGSSSSQRASSAAESELEVEQIVEKRVERRTSKLRPEGETQYLVKWKGYDDSENTWESAEKLPHCVEKVLEYERRSAEKGTHVIRERGTMEARRRNVPLRS